VLDGATLLLWHRSSQLLMYNSLWLCPSKRIISSSSSSSSSTPFFFCCAVAASPPRAGVAFAQAALQAGVHAHLVFCEPAGVPCDWAYQATCLVLMDQDKCLSKPLLFRA
jgi:hypothetical protein